MQAEREDAGENLLPAGAPGDRFAARGYVGRFAPSPTGPLHAGSLVAAMASWLDARAHGGRWLLRMEDLDRPRNVPGAAEHILATLDRLGFVADGPVVWQSRRHAAYEAAFARLRAAGHVYGCACTRREIAQALAAAGVRTQRHVEPVYPGTCRDGLPPGRAPRAWRARVDARPVRWVDRADGIERVETLPASCGDFVLLRADGIWAYQLAVVVDDGEAGVTDVVRGADLASSTARQIRLQEWLGLPTPRYLHVPLVVGEDGEKLSKQNGARALDLREPLAELGAAAAHLGLGRVEADSIGRFWELATEAWARRMGLR
jgi:glutamyl-Q tRNA(Asp) synthetase